MVRINSLFVSFVFLTFSFLVVVSQKQDLPVLNIVNLSQECFRCLCYAASGCNLTVGCESGYCGPYKISKIYWKDAGEVILPNDEIGRVGAYEDCALSYYCAQRIVTNYIAKFGRDCNNDGVTNCDDYSMINFNGGYQCKHPLDRNEEGREWLQRYRACYPDTRL